MTERHAVAGRGHIVGLMAECWLVGIAQGGYAARACQDPRSLADLAEPQDERTADRAQAGAQGPETYLCPTG
jgi:hypothetical protein